MWDEQHNYREQSYPRYPHNKVRSNLTLTIEYF